MGIGLLSLAGLALCSCSSEATSSGPACSLLSPSQASTALGSHATPGPDCLFFGQDSSVLNVSQYSAPGLPSQALSYSRLVVDGIPAVWIPAGSPAPGGGVTTGDTLDFARSGHVVNITLTKGEDSKAKVEQAMGFVLKNGRP